MLVIAHARCNVPVTILRVGQIAAPMSAQGKGLWPKGGWVASLLETSKSMNLVPSTEFLIDWIPVDELAWVIRDIVHCACASMGEGSTHEAGLQVYNIVNPQTVPWNTFMEELSRKLTASRTVSLAEWVASLICCDSNVPEELDRLPALKILPFFQALVALEKQQEGKHLHFETSKAVAASKTMAGLQPCSKACLKRWVSYLD